MSFRRAAALTAAVAALCVAPGVSPATPAKADPAIKPVIQGLLDRKGVPAAQNVPELDGFVVLTSWAALQPTAGGPIAANNPIDKAIAAIRSNPAMAGYHLKLRILTGVDAPAWAKSLGGAPVNVYKGRKIQTMGRFWTPEFGAAYADFQQELAAKYDSVPEVAEVVISRCMIMTAEPFLRAGRKDDRTRQAMVAAGYTVAADTTCQTEEIDAHAVWTTTRSGLTVDPYDRVAADGSYSEDLSFTEDIMAYCRQTLGPRCVLENDAISSPLLGGLYPSLYADIRSYGSPIGFQTRDPVRVGDWADTLNWAVDQGANYVELNIQYPTYDPTVLASIRQQLQANPAN